MNPVSYLDSLQGSGIRPGLSRMRGLLRVAGRPEKSFPSVLVAGTNGKGSTAATLESIFLVAGYRAALYTSPHLVDLRERWRIGGKPISPRTFDGAVVELRAISRAAQIVPTYFEALTLLAFLAFRRAVVDIAILEVGMGGRLDATNVVRPIASLVTSVGLDHTEYLGNTIRAIAREKAGVIHRGSFALTSADHPDALAVLRRRAAKCGSDLIVTSEVTAVARIDSGLDGLGLELKTPDDFYRLRSPLPGRHQIENISLAVLAAEKLRPEFPNVTRGEIVRGVGATRWRGRLEQFDLDGRQIFVDGAHNVQATQRLVPFIKQLREPRLLIFAVMRDKQVREICSTLFPLFDSIFLTVADETRGMPVEELTAIANELRIRTASFRKPAAALRRAMNQGSEGAIVVAGSLYLAGSAIAFLDRLKDTTILS